jgi:hypothetical protein
MIGSVGTVGGYPSIIWPRVPVPGLPVAATTRLVDVFVGHDQYELECQATAPQRIAIGRACHQMLVTFKANQEQP